MKVVVLGDAGAKIKRRRKRGTLRNGPGEGDDPGAGRRGTLRDDPGEGDDPGAEKRGTLKHDPGEGFEPGACRKGGTLRDGAGEEVDLGAGRRCILRDGPGEDEEPGTCRRCMDDSSLVASPWERKYVDCRVILQSPQRGERTDFDCREVFCVLFVVLPWAGVVLPWVGVPVIVADGGG